MWTCLPPVALPDHVPRRGLRLEHRALQVHVDDVIEHLLGDVLGLLLAIQADAVDQNVEPAEMRGDLVHHPARFGTETASNAVANAS